ncbi:hypothetical protein GCM10017786_33080 [Amycolatopsis deserti]|uniref:Secreted protein n=1 Tax=Amycolatopsis deserti TaxID=185696 RepID=A0ABQ3IXQ8_9PSEU|nr:hypothetical protein GCM10017786_33080 [Amycolatopsis deserti]
MTTHDRWFAPPRSATMVGRAVETIVWSSAASSIPSMIAATMVFRARLLVTPRTLVLVRSARGLPHPMVWGALSRASPEWFAEGARTPRVQPLRW